MNNALVSIILPTHNGERFIAESIDSCLSQTHKNIELIIIDDCSDDSTSDIIKSYIGIDHRVKIITQITKGNLPIALNTGHADSNGEYITWTSDDNVYNNDAIEIMVSELIKTKTDIVYSDYTIIDSESKILKKQSVKDPDFIIYGNPIGSSFLYKREVFFSSSGYPENLPLVEDYHFWLHSSKKYVFYKIPESLYKYRINNESLTSKINTDSSTRQLFINNLKHVYLSFFNNFDEDELSLLIRIHQCNDLLFIDNDIFTFLKLNERINKLHTFIKDETFLSYSRGIYSKINKKKEKYPLTDLSKILKYIPYYFQLTSNKIRKQMIKEYFLN